MYRLLPRIPIIGILFFLPTLAHAQFWHAMPPVGEDKIANANFSQDEKKVFFVSTQSGIANIWSVPVKGGQPVQVTKFTDHGVVRAFHLINRPEVLFMRATDATGKDFHIYRMNDDGSGTPQDLTPGGPGVTSQIIGASYNGRYVYFTNNSVSKDETDTYRYDTEQFITELIFPNDKDYQVISWSRDHGRLLMQDPATGALTMYDINSTERLPLAKPASGKYVRAIMDPSSHDLIVIDNEGGTLKDKVMDLTTRSWVDAKSVSPSVWSAANETNVDWVDYSPNGKYLILHDGTNHWSVRELPEGAVLGLPADARPVSIAPKETMLLYTTPAAAGGEKLYLYDIAKKTSTELATLTQ